MALAKALHVSQQTSALSIPHVTASVFVPGNDVWHASHLTQLGVQVKNISDAFHLLSDLNATLHTAIINEWFVAKLP